VVGIGLALPLIIRYIEQIPTFSPGVVPSHLAVTGVMLVVFGFMTFTFTLVLHAVILSRAPSSAGSESAPVDDALWLSPTSSARR
jgi:hypothetical protein